MNKKYWKKSYQFILLFKIELPSGFWVLDKSESKGSPLWFERNDSPWESCWHIVLMVSCFSVRGDDSGIGVTVKNIYILAYYIVLLL